MNWYLRFEVEGKSSILVVVELAVGRLAGGSDAVETEFSGSGLPGVDETPDVAAERAETKAVARTDYLK